MSEHSISIVPKQSAYAGKEIKAREILEWLVSLDIVKPTLSDCILSFNEGYAISNGAKKVSREPHYLPFSLNTNGLEIIIERRVFHTGENGIEKLICPSCKQDIANKDWIFLDEWSDNKNNNLICPLCGVGTDIHQYKFVPEWGFSDLGFTFWNWPDFTDDFINLFIQKLAPEVNIVYTHI